MSAVETRKRTGFVVATQQYRSRDRMIIQGEIMAADFPNLELLLREERYCRHASAQEVKDAVECVEEGCDRRFTSEGAMLRHISIEHAEPEPVEPTGVVAEDLVAGAIAQSGLNPGPGYSFEAISQLSDQTPPMRRS